MSPDCVAKHGRNISGFAIASNIQPEMFTAYLKKATESSDIWDQNNEKRFMKDAEHSVIAANKGRIYVARSVPKQ